MPLKAVLPCKSRVSSPTRSEPLTGTISRTAQPARKSASVTVWCTTAIMSWRASYKTSKISDKVPPAQPTRIRRKNRRNGWEAAAPIERISRRITHRFWIANRHLSAKAWIRTWCSRWPNVSMKNGWVRDLLTRVNSPRTQVEVRLPPSIRKSWLSRFSNSFTIIRSITCPRRRSSSRTKWRRVPMPQIGRILSRQERVHNKSSNTTSCNRDRAVPSSSGVSIETQLNRGEWAVVWARVPATPLTSWAMSVVMEGQLRITDRQVAGQP